MIDPRMTRLAEVLINYSTALKPGEKILIEAFDVPAEMICELIRVARGAGADPLVTLKNNRVQRSLITHGSETQMELIAETEALRMRQVDAYIGIRGNVNIAELSDVPTDAHKRYQKTVWQKVHLGIRVPHTRWVVLRWPLPAMAQQANRSTEAFEDFYFDVCTMDYARMSQAMKPLSGRITKADQVKIVGPGTDLTFSIKGMAPVECSGRLNIPDGEVYTAPVRESVDGTLQYNARTIYQGTVHDDVRFEFHEGKIIKATSSNTDALNKVLDTDEGARYIGEFSLGVNPFVTEPMLEPLFDEKIAGSFHFTPGNAYDDADNGNRSSVHWDIVCLQDAERGGGEIWFDGQLIRKDGLFVPDDLKSLNPENLK
jgi:aminopeptidase